MKIKFPKKEQQHYYRYHYTFLLNVFKEAGINVEFCPSTELDTTHFTIEIDNKKVLIDVSDDPKLHPKYKNYDACFKYHVTEHIHEGIKNLFPLGAMSFYNWDDYFVFWHTIKYKCNNDIILNNQRVYANAKERRRKVQHLLTSVYKKDVDFKLTDQTTYWKKANNCLVSVHVPGYRNDILDRGQFQMMAFGVCTISPKINTILPYNISLISGVDYIKCKDDYSDLIEKIEWCKTHRKECIKIGQNAKDLFQQYCTPKKIVKWIGQCLKQ